MAAAEKVRLNLQVSQELADTIDRLAEESGSSKSDVIRRALAVVIAYSEQKKKGRGHLGFTADATKLDAEILNVL